MSPFPIFLQKCFKLICISQIFNIGLFPVESFYSGKCKLKMFIYWAIQLRTSYTQSILKQKMTPSPLVHFIRLEGKKRTKNYPDFTDTFFKISHLAPKAIAPRPLLASLWLFSTFSSSFSILQAHDSQGMNLKNPLGILIQLSSIL